MIPLATTAWLYVPAGGGAFAVETARQLSTVTILLDGVDSLLRR